MKNVKKALLVLALATGAAACGEAGLQSSAAAEKTGIDDPARRLLSPDAKFAHVAPGAVIPSSIEGATRIDLRLKGINAKEDVTISVKSVEAVVAGRTLPVYTVDAPIELSRIDHAARIATIEMPANARFVEFLVHLDEVGMINGKKIDLSGPPMRFRTSAAKLLEKGKAVVYLDVEESVAVSPNLTALLPNFSVRY